MKWGSTGVRKRTLFFGMISDNPPETETWTERNQSSVGRVWHFLCMRYRYDEVVKGLHFTQNVECRRNAYVILLEGE